MPFRALHVDHGVSAEAERPLHVERKAIGIADLSHPIDARSPHRLKMLEGRGGIRLGHQQGRQNGCVLDRDGCPLRLERQHGMRRVTDQPDAALKMLDQAVAAGMKTAKVYLNYALTYMKQSRLPEALDAAAKARSRNLNATEPVLVMGRIHFALEDYESAKDDYDWAIAHTSWPVESYYWLGRAELELGQTEAAVEHLRKAVERITEDPLLSDITVSEASVWLEKAEKAVPPDSPATAE